jgi:hypothetical protein
VGLVDAWERVVEVDRKRPFRDLGIDWRVMHKWIKISLPVHDAM